MICQISGHKIQSLFGNISKLKRYFGEGYDERREKGTENTGDVLIMSYPADAQLINAEPDSGYRPHAVSGLRVGGAAIMSYVYDENGNMTLGPDIKNPGHTRLVKYNFDNMPTHVYRDSETSGNLLASFLYDGNAVRAKKSSGGVDTYYVSNDYEVRNNDAVKYIFAGNLRIAKIDNQGVGYYHKDHLGSSTIVTRNGSEEDELTLYRPFGLDRTPPKPGDSTNYKFTDQELDKETGFYESAEFESV